MSIRFEHAIDVTKGPEQIFAVLDDFSKTPQWLERCTGIEKLSPGPNSVGTKIRYAYREGGRTGTMDGEIRARTANERLTMGYADKMMEVVVDFHMTKKDGGARLVHTVDIRPKSLFAKLFAPLVRRQLPKQTIAAMETLRTLVEGGRNSGTSSPAT
jgi:carbon monoxide dehydrogenase subunit G